MVKSSIEVMRAVGDVIKKSAAVNNFCQTNYSKSMIIYIGLDPGELPPQDDYPIFCIAMIDPSDKGEQAQKQTLGAAFGVGIVQEAAPTRSTPDPETGAVVVEYPGLLEVEELRRLVEADILKAKGFGAKVQISSETALESSYPVFRSSCEINFQFPISRRGGRV